MAKIDSKEVLERIRRRQAANSKSNYTYRLPDQIMRDFKKKCEKEGVSMTSVLEELIEEFLK